jgi:hypothetical protein
MIAKKYAMLIAIGACLIGLSGLGSTKHPVERPIKVVLHETMILNLADGSWELSGIGWCSHLGLVENQGGWPYLDESGEVVSKGVTTAANGDQIFWSSADQATAFFTGGTGRFQGATGSMTTVSMEMVELPNPPPGCLVFDVLLDNEGTVTY